MNKQQNAKNKDLTANFGKTMLPAAFVLSGKCRIGEVGEPTPLKDFIGKELYVGDIVITSVIDEFGICDNVRGLCVRWGFPSQKLNSSNNFKLNTND